MSKKYVVLSVNGQLGKALQDAKALSREGLDVTLYE